MIKNILNLDKVILLKKEQQKSINAGSFDRGCPQFRACWKDSDCPCGGCGVTIGGHYIDDLCAF
ncbi:hypothetical protein ATO12_03205 [Aquimarina atlantica]|uniref:Uncharacterized protein n=1 Tax=Aquimarina atlantica TaxID=1317122 RepID=A0A023C0S8_9FLAO|nr:hypothetical protein [Aquimarina atlantica]EZH75809.1 hypothetical protein ATO12_03205 [Aquimarina atlantica]